MSEHDLPLVLVVYDQGSLGAKQIIEAAGEAGCRLAFLATGSEQAQDLRPVLETYGTVIDARDYGTRQALLHQLHKLEPAGITTFAERQLRYTAEIAAGLDLPYQDLSDIPAITIKAAQRERLRVAGVDALPSTTVTDLEESEKALQEIGLPAIVKPNVGSSSRNTFRADTVEEYRSGMARVLSAPPGDPDHEDCLVVEEVLIGRQTPEPWGDYVAMDSLVQDGVVHPLFFTGKFSPAPPFRERGAYCPPKLTPEEMQAVKDLAARAARAMNFRQGFVDVEMRLTPDGPRIIEVNGRMGGWVDHLAQASGSGKPAVMALTCALGKPVDIRPQTGTPQRIAYAFLAGAPMWARRVRSMPGLGEMRALDGVDRVSLHLRPGAPVDWRKGTYGASLAAFQGRVQTHEQLAEIVRRIELMDWIEFEA
ncbi:ATP-grasp domain-containing protein [Catenulispora pinisilvae]|uniref:ATP-grasp domain-containing protein n=1 Tax=Catenulispora pinisilvae TaxID=2705253 RepID=UPI0018915F37|nr:ATP-grasp domain-containing protein [Catenulispora pinisilvae]